VTRIGEKIAQFLGKVAKTFRKLKEAKIFTPKLILNDKTSTCKKLQK
jgi:hypothetical protein